MMGRRREHPSANGSGTQAPAGIPNTERCLLDELDGLSIEELEPRLTPDGWGPPPPPDRQVGWGC
jgi:hypothetical protein